jgi:galactokinase
VFGTGHGVRVFRAPGRVNLIGEHTDYNLGFVLPIALDLACFVATAPNRDGKLRVHSTGQGETREWEAAELAELAPSRHWSDYPAGVAQQLLQAGYRVEPQNLLVRSSVPIGSGLSSSAALEVSTALALLGDQEIDRLELAKLCRRAENEFVGMPCGIMDQYISVFGRDHAGVKIDCRSLDHEMVPLPENVEIVAANTMVKHELGQSAYRERVAECRSVVEALRQSRPEVESLRDADEEKIKGLIAMVAATPRKRARHVVSENARVEEFVKASRAGDLPRMGELFEASHRSLQHDYEVSCEELDFLVDAAMTLPGVWGSRMTGGGFGGCTVNLVRPDAAVKFRRGLAEAYHQRFGLTPEFYSCRPSAGAGEIP